MPLFDQLHRGDKRDFHVSLFEGEIECLDRLATENKCSRSTVIGALIRQYRLADLGIPEGADELRKRRKTA